MSTPNGYILLLSKGRLGVFEERDDGERFAQAVSEFAHSRNQPLLCFIGTREGGITHIGFGRRGQRAGNEQRRLNIANIEALEPISLKLLGRALPARFATAFAKRLKRGGLLSPRLFEAVVEQVVTLRPDLKKRLSNFLSSRRNRLKKLSPAAKESLAWQKEAVATAFSIANFPRDALRGWDYSAKAPELPSFLAGIPRLLEDQMVVHDLTVFPGFRPLAGGQFAHTRFEDDKRRLSILLANRLPLERQTGADLIYYNETFQCFVLVQYKAMEDEHGGREPIYRFPNDQLTKELARMDAILEGLHVLAPNREADGFRLTENPFFLKICPRIRFDPDATGLSSGMYLPLGYWKLIAEHPSLLGGKGGRQISFRNVRRYMDNTHFAAVVASGWVGTNLDQSSLIERLVAEILESGKALVYAVHQDVKSRNRSSDEDYADHDLSQ